MYFGFEGVAPDIRKVVAKKEWINLHNFAVPFGFFEPLSHSRSGPSFWHFLP
jgi:hypothetical protein